MTYQMNPEHRNLNAFGGVHSFDLDPINRSLVVYGKESFLYNLDSRNKIVLPLPPEHLIEIKFSGNAILGLTNNTVLRLHFGTQKWIEITKFPEYVPEKRWHRQPRRIVLAPDGQMVIFSQQPSSLDPWLHRNKSELVARNLTSLEDELLPLKFNSKLEALDISADGRTLAVSTGCDFRVLCHPKKRANWLKHQKLHVQGLMVSRDGQYAASWGLYPTDFRQSPSRSFIWHIPSRKLLQVVDSSQPVGFLGTGESTMVALRLMQPTKDFLTILKHPVDPKPVDTLQKPHISKVRGDGKLVGYLTGDERLIVIERKNS